MLAWNAAWRARALPELAARDWDVVVVGGGINGAGILREAARCGWTCLLLEQRDFAWGTSSRSSKMIHGGLRYLASGHWRLTRTALRERQHLSAALPGLVEPLHFLVPHARGHAPGRWTLAAALALCERLAGRRSMQRHYHSARELRWLAPQLRPGAWSGATQFVDAQVDDARLVLRVLDDARRAGGAAVNGVRVREPLRIDGRVAGVVAEDTEGSARWSFRSRVVVRATGAWTDAAWDTAAAAHANARIRPLRGAHLLVPGWRLPLAQAITFSHPADGRIVFAFPWQGATVIGTTDVDHHDDPASEPRISRAEFDYLLAACRWLFPTADITAADVRSTWAGVRAVLRSGSQRTPSAEPREHALWSQPGCVTLTGGKLTTFHAQALEAVRECARQLQRPFSPAPAHEWEKDSGRICASGTPLPPHVAARHGTQRARLAQLLDELGDEPVAATTTLWAELALAAECELVLHLDDLLLRRTRLGLLLARGGEAELTRIRATCQRRLGWDDARWEHEQHRYLALWRRCYSAPGNDAGVADE